MIAAPAMLSAFVGEAGTEKRLYALDALRGLAALMVAIEHIARSLPPDSSVPPALIEVLAFGGNGVPIFFVLSGVVIPFAVGQARVTPRYVARFIARRFIRLDVPYWACIAAYLIGAKVVGKHLFDDMTPGVLLANLFYLNFLLGLQPVIVVGWSLAIEIQFYLAYLLLMALSQLIARRFELRAFTARLAVFAVPTMVSLLWLLTIIPDPPGSETVFLQPWLFFFGGAAVTWALQQGMPAWPVGFAALGLLVSAVVTWSSAPWVGAATVVAIFAAGRRGLLSERRGKWLQRLGTISYSLYLLHPLVGSRPIRLWRQLHPEPWSFAQSCFAFAAAIASSLVIAAVFSRLIEQPSQRLARRISLQS
jgi:peptidoglycan/LPS O-acetylase OafA/YrhL